ncbi:hypothetical protein [Burkholderia glumae]|uniref:hypothetical protein n=1 Tax=Burkholderia glumae TaxID=337 RepID=UPI0021513762|nr:hypothetical protein [Burkholderia glumae]CAJ3384901.1 Uncharacterised protein [Burkholderia pseudomallei]
MSKIGIAGSIKLHGNIKRMQEIVERGSVHDVVPCFESGGMSLHMAQGDFPLLKNLPELTRVALPKRFVDEYFAENKGMSPNPA